MTMDSHASQDWNQTGMIVSSHTVAWPQSNLLAFLRRGGGQRRFFWESERSPIAFAAFGAAAVLTAGGETRFRNIRKQAADLFSRIHNTAGPEIPPQVANARLVGGFSFRRPRPRSATRTADIWDRFPQAYFVLPRYALIRLDGETYLTVNTLARQQDEWASHDALWNLPAPLDIPVLEAGAVLVSPIELLDEAHWRQIVSAATDGIRSGRFEKIVLARAREIKGVANPLAALARLSGRYPDCFRFLVEAAPGHSFFGATPELLVCTEAERVKAMALAGSIRRGDTLADDDALGARLLASPKELWEHRLVVQAVSERLEPFVAGVRIGETGLLKLSNIQHLHTPISGVRSGASHLLDIVAALHPTPAVGGLPSGPGQVFIEKAEPVSRGWYAGPVGWFDSLGCGEFAVSLRSAVMDGHRTRLYAGAGIVADSDPEREWQETELKFRPMMEALGCAPL